MEILRYTAFTDTPAGGNPAGVVLDATGLDAAAMQRIAAEVGYSETAFLFPTGDSPSGERAATVRYFSPVAEVAFCGHATIATAVAYAERFGDGPIRLLAPVGEIPVDTAGGRATLTSVPPRTARLGGEVLRRLLQALRYIPEDLDPGLPPRTAFAGNWHPIVAVTSRERLAALDYDEPALRALMVEQDWTTADLIWRESETVFHARNPFPPGGVYEDPATGAAAAALGGYLRELALVPAPSTVTVHQGDDMGRPSLLEIGLDAPLDSGVRVSGSAVPVQQH